MTGRSSDARPPRGDAEETNRGNRGDGEPGGKRRADASGEWRGDGGRERRSDASGSGNIPDASGGRTTLPRRPFLAALGATALGVGAVGTVEAGRWDDVIDVVDDEGADNTGGESVTPILERIRDTYGDDTLVKFPDGRYYMDSQFRYTDFSNFGVVGGGVATLVPANYYDFDGPQYRLFRFGTDYAPGKDLRFAGFHVDQTANDTGIRVVEALVTDGLSVEDVHVRGQHDSGTYGPGFFAITDDGGSGTVRQFMAPDGGRQSYFCPGNIEKGPTGILLSEDHVGTIELRDCILGGFPDNGLYGTTYGTVRVVGGHYRNSNTASIRLGGYDCLVRGTKVAVDANPQNFPNQRGIRLDAGTGFRVENVTIDLSAPNGHAMTVKDHVGTTRIQDVDVTIGDRVNHGIVVRAGANETHIQGTTVQIDGGGNAIRLEGSDAGKVVVKETDVWGQASGATFRHAIRCERDNCELRKVKVWQPGTHRRRAVVLNGDDCVVYDSTLVAREHAVVVGGDGAWIEANYLDSYDNDAAVLLEDSSSNVTIKDNELKNRVRDEGSDGLRMYGNT